MRATRSVTDVNRNVQENINIFLVNAAGWVSYEDVFPDSLHRTVEGQIKIANEFTAWLENWGLSPK
jgi:hypothetical protein